MEPIPLAESRPESAPIPALFDFEVVPEPIPKKDVLAHP